MSEAIFGECHTRLYHQLAINFRTEVNSDKIEANYRNMMMDYQRSILYSLSFNFFSILHIQKIENTWKF